MLIFQLESDSKYLDICFYHCLLRILSYEIKIVKVDPYITQFRYMFLQYLLIKYIYIYPTLYELLLKLNHGSMQFCVLLYLILLLIFRLHEKQKFLINIILRHDQLYSFYKTISKKKQYTTFTLTQLNLNKLFNHNFFSISKNTNFTIV